MLRQLIQNGSGVESGYQNKCAPKRTEALSAPYRMAISSRQVSESAEF